MKLEGLSFRYCVQDILLGRVRYHDVVKIVARTSARDDEEWTRVIEEYLWSWSWAGTPGSALEVAWGLIDEGKVEQPLLTGNEIHDLDRGYHWVDTDTRELISVTDLRFRSTD